MIQRLFHFHVLSFVFATLVIMGSALGQGLDPDVGGHATLNGHNVFACWNLNAGTGLTEDYSRYQEFLPNLKGWDFRINLPHIQFQLARAAGAGSPAAMVGVEEGGDIVTYGHANNSIWIFQAGGGDNQMHGKILPSRRDLNGSSTENISDLRNNWFGVGSNMPSLLAEKPAVVALGKGLNSARIYVVARDQSGALFMTAHTVVGNETVTISPPISGLAIGPIGGIVGHPWDDEWRSLGIASSVAPALSETFDGKLALAYFNPGQSGVVAASLAGVDTGAVDTSPGMRVRVYNPSDNTWGPAVAVPDAIAVHPQLVWDGTALNLFFVQTGTPLLQQTYALSDSPLTFFNRRSVSGAVAVFGEQFHAIAFNNRLHVAIRQDNGSTEGPVFYMKTTGDPGRPSTWSTASDTGLTSNSRPSVAWMYENIVVVGTPNDGRVRFSRLDPNRPDNADTGGALSDQWLQAASDVDPTGPTFLYGPETLSFNSDVYLTANVQGENSDLYIVNLSRAVLKQLMTGKWGMHLLWGEPGGARVLRAGEFGSGGDIPAVGDVNHDGFQELFRFNQTGNGDGNAPVYRHRNINGDLVPNGDVIATDFSHAGEVPMVGDFDGDGVSDAINFVQKPLSADGVLIGYAPVFVLRNSSPSNGELWNDNFAGPGEIPYVGDVNGDGKDDIISFVQTPISDFDGHLVAQAAVFVSLSDGNHFGPAQMWHTDFSHPGEIPMVGDFNGDGKVDIINFTQHSVDGVGTAPVYVALSTGTGFGAKTVWHTFFSLPGEAPLVGDLNFDGRDDIITCIADKQGETEHPRNIYAATSLAYKFDRSFTWHSDFVTGSQVIRGPLNRTYSPIVGHQYNKTMGGITGVSADYQKYVPNMFAFSSDGSVHIALSMGNVPYPPGEPWERYKFFTDKGLGVALEPEWIYQHTGHCISSTHRLALNGLGGVGGGDLTVTSVRYGGRAPHIQEELGHSIFANCLRSNADPFGVYDLVYNTPIAQGGIGAPYDGPLEALPGCPDPNGFLSCRPDAPGEHYFLELLSRYRLNPEMFRQRIATESDPGKQADLAAQYQWVKQYWYENREFATASEGHASLDQAGVPLLPDPQPPVGMEVPVDNGGGTCGSGGACGAGAPLMLLLTLTGLRNRPRIRKQSKNCVSN